MTTEGTPLWTIIWMDKADGSWNIRGVESGEEQEKRYESMIENVRRVHGTDARLWNYDEYIVDRQEHGSTAGSGPLF